MCSGIEFARITVVSSVYKSWLSTYCVQGMSVVTELHLLTLVPFLRLVSSCGQKFALGVCFCNRGHFISVWCFLVCTTKALFHTAAQHEAKWLLALVLVTLVATAQGYRSMDSGDSAC